MQVRHGDIGHKLSWSVTEILDRKGNPRDVLKKMGWGRCVLLLIRWSITSFFLIGKHVVIFLVI